MHEMTMMQGILAAAHQALAGYEAGRVAAIKVRAGVLANIMPDALSFAFEMQSQGTQFQDADFILEISPLVARCLDCGLEYESTALPPICPRCNSRRLEIVSGSEVLVESIDFEEEQRS